MNARGLVLSVLVVAVGVLVFSAAPALAGYVEGSPPRFKAPETTLGVAVDNSGGPSTGSVYAVGGNGVVQKFSEAGVPEDFSGLGSSEFSVGGGTPYQIAVDNSGGASQGDFYVVTLYEGVFKFDASGLPDATDPKVGEGKFEEPSAVAVDSSGDVYIADYPTGKVYGFSASGAALNSGAPVLEGLTAPNALALNNKGDLYVAETGVGTVEFPSNGSGGFDPTSTTVDPNSAFGVTVDEATNDVFVDNYTFIEEFNEGGSLVGEAFGPPNLNNSNADAFSETTQTVFAANDGTSEVELFAFERAGPTLTVVKEGGGALQGIVKSTPPKIDCGAGEATCSSEFKENSTVTLTEEPGNATFTGWSGACTGTGACEVTMSAAMEVKATFITPPSELEISEPELKFSEPVTTTTATFTGSVNPGGAATYYLEYGTELCPNKGCGEKSAPLTLGGASRQAVGPITLSSLKPGTVYYVWLVATNAATQGLVHSEATVLKTPQTPVEEAETAAARTIREEELAASIAAQTRREAEAAGQHAAAAASAAAAGKQYDEIAAQTTSLLTPKLVPPVKTTTPKPVKCKKGEVRKKSKCVRTKKKKARKKGRK